jgi:hypothetical protein
MLALAAERRDDASPAAYTDADETMANHGDVNLSEKPMTSGDIHPDSAPDAPQPSVTKTTDAPLFYFDTRKGASTPMGQPSEDLQRPLSRQSSSSDEVILFKGRNARQGKAKPSTTNAQPILAPEQVQVAVEVKVQITEEQVHAPPKEDDFDLTLSRPKRSRGKRTQKRRSARDEAQDAMLADYIANMEEHGEMMDLSLGTYAKRDIGGSQHDGPNSDEFETADEKGGASNEELLSGSDLDEALALALSKDLVHDSHAVDIDDDSSSSESDAKQEPRTASRNIPSGYEDFDPMDWERPSLRRRKGKAAKGRITFDADDSETEAHLQAAWSNDRLKKSERKKQREQMRALGMLGKKADPEDLRVKYPDGMSLPEISEELRAFLMSEEETLWFPPMDTHARKMIHQLAGKFNVKSKSAGKADTRRPVLYRTLRTLPYVDATFEQAIARVRRQYYPRLDVKGKRGPKPTPMRSNNQAASYRDGEIIGGTAPELGVQNRGRAMLEKMGWSTGTALGATENKGILQPVTQAMKRTKAGLG